MVNPLSSSQYGSSKRLWERRGSAFVAGFSISRERDGDLHEVRTPAPESAETFWGLPQVAAIESRSLPGRAFRWFYEIHTIRRFA
jgi:hypothetical protein